MAIMSWSDSYSVNVIKIDNQHKRLFALVNDLHDAMSQGKGKDVLETTLSALLDYTNVHFGEEEKMMAAANYPDLPAHKKEHEAFVKKVIDLQTDFLNKKIALTNEVWNFLKDWLINHILKVDKKYAPFLKK